MASYVLLAHASSVLVSNANIRRPFELLLKIHLSAAEVWQRNPHVEHHSAEILGI